MSNGRIGWKFTGKVADVSASRLLSGGAWALGGRVATALLVLVVNALIARILTPEEVGTYYLAFSLVSVGALLGAMGLNQAVVRFVAEALGRGDRSRARYVTSVTLMLGLSGAICVAVLYVAVGPILGYHLFSSTSLVAITWLLAVWMVALSLQTVVAETFRGFDDIRAATLFSGLGTVTWGLLAGGLSLLWLFEVDATLAKVVVIAISSSFVSVVVAGALLKSRLSSLPSHSGRDDEFQVGSILRVAWPLLFVNVTLFILTQADLWITGAYLQQDKVAIYGAAARLVTIVVMPLVVVNAVVPPLIARLYFQGERATLERTLRATATLASVPAFAILTLFVGLGAPLLELVYGSFYRQGASILIVLSIGQFVNVWVGSCGYVLAMTGHQATAMVIALSTGGMTIIGGLLLVNPFGTLGVAFATSSGLIFHNILMWAMARYKTSIWTHVDFRAVPQWIRGIS